MKIEINNFTPLYDSMVQRYGLVRASIYGRIERYSWKYGYCFASKDTLGEQLKVSAQTIRNHVAALIEDGYVVDLDPDSPNRVHRLQPTGKARFEIVIDAIDEGEDPALNEIEGTLNEIEGRPKEVEGTLNEVDTNKEVQAVDFKKEIKEDPQLFLYQTKFEAWKEYGIKPNCPASTYLAHVEPLKVIDYTPSDSLEDQDEVVVGCRRGDEGFVLDRFIEPKGFFNSLCSHLGNFNFKIKIEEVFP